MKKHIGFGLALLAGLLFATSGCATQERVVVRDTGPAYAVVKDGRGAEHRVVVVAKKPPKVRREKYNRAPSRRHVRIPGHWEWQRGRYVWEAGRWAVPPPRFSRWAPGRWQRHQRGWVFIGGYWR